MKKLTLIGLILLPAIVHAQDDLIKKIELNKSYVTVTDEKDQKKYHFTKLIDLEHTDVCNQASSGTCWSYSTNSFLESEMMRMGKKPIKLAEIFSAHCVYLDKADAYVRMHGAISWGDGGECHDVINMYAKYGAMPQEVYTGLHYGTTKNKFAEMQAILKSMLDAVVSNPNGKLTPSWKKAYIEVLNSYLGAIPEKFKWGQPHLYSKNFRRRARWHSSRRLC